jgi:hypothetical protein
MQDQDMPDPGRVLDEVQRCVLCVLLASAGCGLCSMHELAVVVGDREAAELAIVGLHAEGLVHRLDGFVFATRPVTRAYELDVLGGRPGF